MGNVFSIIRNKYNSLTSGNSSSKDIAEEVDKIATQYILTQDAIELLKLKDTKYYDNLVILTRDVLLKHLNSKELTYLYEYKKNGEKFEEMKKTNVIALNKNNLDEYDVKNKTQKKRMAYAIAKYYVKIAHVYAAIASTIDPEYKYTETDGSEKSFHLHDFDNLANIPVDALSSLKVQSLNNPMALCKKRLDTLMNKFDLNSKSDIIINPGEKFCNMNYDTELNDSKVLSKEPGIETLDKLYNDVYNTETGAWDKRSPKMEQEFNKDLKLFHETFTAKSQMPEDIKSFSDIKLIDFHTLPGCKDENSEYRKDYTGHVNDPLFYKYANTIKKMIRESDQGKNKLLKILKKLFITKEIEIEEYDEDSDIENEEELNNEEQNEEETMNDPIMEDAISDMSSENEDELDAEKTETVAENNDEDESDAEERENNDEDESDAEERENNIEGVSDDEKTENNDEGVSDDEKTETTQDNSTVETSEESVEIPDAPVENSENSSENSDKDESYAEKTDEDKSDAENNVEGVSDDEKTETIQDNSTVETSEESVESPNGSVENSSENSEKDKSKSENMFDNILSTFNINNKSETQTNKDVEENKDNSSEPLTGGKEASPSIYIKKTVVINPKITDKKLLSIANEARKEILKLYINCEKNFFEALLIYEAIVRTKLVARTTSRLEKAKGLLQKMITTKNLSSEDIIKLKKTLLNTSDELNEEETLSMISNNSEKNEDQEDESKKVEEEADEEDESKRIEEEAVKEDESKRMEEEAERKRMEEEAIAEAERKRIEAEEATAEAERKRIEAEEATAEAERKRKQEEEAMEEAERKRKQEEEAMEEAKRKREEAETNTDSSIMNDDDTKTPENAFSSSTQANESEGMEANEMQGNETPANEMPANEMPANEMPANETPANEMPANEMPANETPANEMPANEMPANEMPANETPANETPANEMPANEMQGNEMQGNEMQGNEMQGNETQANQMPGNETPAMPAENSSENNENEEYFAKLLGDEKSNDNEMNTSKESPPTDTDINSKIGGGGLNDIKMLKHLGGGLIGGDPFIDNFIKGFKKLTRKRHKKKRSKTKTVHGKSKKKNKKKKINVKKTSKNKK